MLTHVPRRSLRVADLVLVRLMSVPFSPKAFVIAFAIYLGCLPIVFFVAVFGSFAAFSPNYHGPNRTHREGDRTFSDYTLFAGSTLGIWILDHTLFDGPSPEMPIDPSNFAGTDLYSKQMTLAQSWNLEMSKRRPVYRLASILNPLLFAFCVGIVGGLLQRRPKA